jgi:hypothetical protein
MCFLLFSYIGLDEAHPISHVNDLSSLREKLCILHIFISRFRSSWITRSSKERVGITGCDGALLDFAAMYWDLSSPE